MFGHQYGDHVLSELAETLTDIFPNDDIVGRLGGDEFIVLLKNPMGLDAVKLKAKNICDAFKRTYTVKNDTMDISASIGIAIAPQDGNSFEILYKKADIALYESKFNGKNQYSFFCLNN